MVMELHEFPYLTQLVSSGSKIAAWYFLVYVLTIILYLLAKNGEQFPPEEGRGNFESFFRLSGQVDKWHFSSFKNCPCLYCNRVFRYVMCKHRCTIKQRTSNVCFIKIHTKLSSVLLLSLVRFFMKQTLTWTQLYNLTTVWWKANYINQSQHKYL